MSKRKTSFALICAFSLTLLFGFFGNTTRAYAFGEANLEKAGLNFMLKQYIVRDIEHSAAEVSDVIIMHDQTSNAVGKIIVINRYDYYDFVTLNLLLETFDEFQFNAYYLIREFQKADKVYYAGNLMYGLRKNNKLVDINGNIIDKESFFEEVSYFVGNTVNSEFGNFYTWSQISSNMFGQGFSFHNWRYLPGTFENGVISGLHFHNQDVLNEWHLHRHGRILVNTCGPVAATNIFTYFQWAGIRNRAGVVHSLRNLSEHDTFDRFLTLSNWNAGGTYMSNMRTAVIQYAGEQGYWIEASGRLDMSGIRSSLDRGHPILSGLWSTRNPNLGHMVVTVGQETFRRQITVRERYTVLFFIPRYRYVTRIEYQSFLRIVDGWSTTNQGRFINHNDAIWRNQIHYSFMISGI
ncbi:MAG: hypothetical protein FWB72_05865 [Firmicutes bacterium]|nr:hypothetical protein [Bacillota bacterium]